MTEHNPTVTVTEIVPARGPGRNYDAACVARLAHRNVARLPPGSAMLASRMRMCVSRWMANRS